MQRTEKQTGFQTGSGFQCYTDAIELRVKAETSGSPAKPGEAAEPAQRASCPARRARCRTAPHQPRAE